ncbi:DNA-binding response regulator [Bacillus sp. CRN 9]|nr:DNA-binding response regulator [Bacillus sp. CRN 9]
MMNSIKILRDSMKDAGEGLTAQYGDESAMPKAQGTTSDPIFKETVRREKRYLKIAQYEDKVKFIQDLIPAIDNDREGEVLHWLLEGKSYRWIGMHMGLSPSHIHRLRDSIVERMAQETNGTNGTNDTKLINHKSAC